MAQYLTLPSDVNYANNCRHLFVHIEEKLISVKQKSQRDEEFHLWRPLFLASDVLAFESVGKCNKSRIHTNFSKQGLATKINLPTGVQFSELPAAHTKGVWFYSVYGVVQAVMQYVSCQAQQLRLIEEFMSTWKSCITDDLLPEKLDNFTILNDIQLVPMPVDLLQNASFLPRKRNQSDLRHMQPITKIHHLCTTSSGSVVRSKRLKSEDVSQLLDIKEISHVPDVAVEVSISSEPTTEQPQNNVNSSASGTDGIKGDIIREQVSPAKSEECQKERINLNSKYATRCCNMWSDGECKLASSEKFALHREVVLEKLHGCVESLKHLRVTDSQCWLQTSIHLILDKILEVETVYEGETRLPDGNLWNNSLLSNIAQWLGLKFNFLVPIVANKVDSFKKANVDQITELPSDRDLIVELFPAAMHQLFASWVGVKIMQESVSNIASSACDQTHQMPNTSKQSNKLGIYSLLLLLLEFSNQALVSGVAHVLYPRFVAS